MWAFMYNLSHQQFMRKALFLAKKGRLTVSPNPMVGCIIVQKNQIVGQGYHKKPGQPHAEIYALQQAKELAKGATAYVTLEPCCHQGKTPPCTAALIEAGIAKVYVATLDPNPLVNGKGVQALKDAGIQVEIGLFQNEALALNEIFFHYIKTKMPFVISKWAMSLDGQTIVNIQDNKQISCHKSQIHTHKLRQKVDAILIGAQTVIDDNPELSVRFGTKSKSKTKQPIRIVVAGTQSLSKDLKIFNPNLKSKTFIFTTFKNEHFFKHLSSQNTEIFCVDETHEGRVSLHHLLLMLGQKGISSVLVEGGVQTRNSFFEENLVNKIEVYLAPNIIGPYPQKRFLQITKSRQLGSDFYFSANFKENSNV